MPQWHQYRAVRVIITINGRISRTETGFHESGLNSHHFIPGDEIGKGENVNRQNIKFQTAAYRKNGSY